MHAIAATVEHLPDATYSCGTQGAMRATLGVLMFSAMAACSTITVQSGPDATIVQRHFGGLWITVDPPERSVTSVRSFGVLSTPIGLNVGVALSSVASLPAECRLMVWVRDEHDVSRIKQTLAPALKEGLCVEKNP